MRRGAGVIKCLQNEINPLDGTQARAKVPLVSVYMVRVVEDYEGVTSRLRMDCDLYIEARRSSAYL